MYCLSTIVGNISQKNIPDDILLTHVLVILQSSYNDSSKHKSCFRYYMAIYMSNFESLEINIKHMLGASSENM